MIADLTEAGYRQTLNKLANLERRLTEIESRNDLTPVHRDRVCKSYREMIVQYKREIKLHEEKHPTDRDTASSPF